MGDMNKTYRDNFAAIDWSRPIVVKPTQQVAPKRSGLSCPSFISDTMNPVQSQLDGRMYDSKSALRSTYKQAGVTEVGNDSSITNPKPFKKPKSDRLAIKKSIDTAFSQAGLGA